VVALVVWVATPGVASAGPCDPPAVLVNGREVIRDQPTLRCNGTNAPLGGGPRPQGGLLGSLPGLGGVLGRLPVVGRL
jgi:hypothetical protein